MTAPVVVSSVARVTVASSRRRIDVAVPGNALVAELLPHLLRHAGEHLADEGERHGGWVLRRTTGTILEPTRNLSAQGVRDGEILHLVSRRVDWPEPAYDDIVEVIASGARRTGRAWDNLATRRCGLAITSALLGAGAVGLVLAASPRQESAYVAAAYCAALLFMGIALSRAFADATAGGVVAGSGLPYALVSGALLAEPDGAVLQVSASSLLVGSAVLLVCSVVGFAGVAALERVFAAGAAASMAGMASSLLIFAGISAAGAAALTLAVVIGLLPGYPLVSSWLGRLPVPEVPGRAEDILQDRPTPKRDDVFARVARATELLTGMLLAAAVVNVCVTVALAAAGSPAGVSLSAAASTALLLRARLFPTPRQRIPLLVGGVAGLTLVALAIAMRTDGSIATTFLVVMGVAAGAVLTASLAFSRRAPSPYLGRIADVADVLAIAALIPLACVVSGIYAMIQGLFAAIGG